MNAARAALAAAILALSGASGCGYAPARAPGRALFAIVPAGLHVADAAATLALEAGARAELARQGSLATCAPARDEGCAAIVVELLRLDDATVGVAAEGGSPLGLGSRTTATGRATLFVGDAREETGEVTASEVLATAETAASELMVRREAARRAAQKLGARLVRRLLGPPEPSSD